MYSSHGNCGALHACICGNWRELHPLVLEQFIYKQAIISHQQAKLKITRLKQTAIVRQFLISAKAAMATLFTSSKVFVMLSVAMCIMLATGAPLVRIRSTDCGTCESGEWIYGELTNIVSYTLLLRNISELGGNWK